MTVRIPGTGSWISIGEKFADLLGLTRGMELGSVTGLGWNISLDYGIKWEYISNRIR
jgi:hypothetical protein